MDPEHGKVSATDANLPTWITDRERRHHVLQPGAYL